MDDGGPAEIGYITLLCGILPSIRLDVIRNHLAKD